MKIKSIKKIEYAGDVYNLHIEDNHNYFANDICVSNCHKGKSDSYSKKILRYTLKNAYYRWGMSGSFPKEDTYEMMEIMAKTGPIVSVVKAKKLMDEGYITKVKIKGILMQHNDFEFAELLETVASADKKSAYDLEVAKIQESEERLGVISQIVGQCKSNTLVLFHNTEYGQRIFEYLKEKNPDKDFYFIDGSVKNNATKKNIENNRNFIKKEMEKTIEKIEYTILNFGDYELEIKSDTEILLTNGTYKIVSDIDENDDIDDVFLNQLRIDTNASSKS